MPGSNPIVGGRHVSSYEAAGGGETAPTPMPASKSAAPLANISTPVAVLVLIALLVLGILTIGFGVRLAVTTGASVRAGR
jgi:hypothetical protein